MGNIALAVIGGTGVYKLAALGEVQTHEVQTRYGAPSGPVRIGLLNGQRVAFLARHGEGHSIPPHKINYRANLAALSHPERVFLGLALLHRYKNSRAGSRFEPLFTLLTAEQIQRAEVLGKAMRFGAMFTIGDPQDAGQLELKAKKGVLELKLTKKGAGLFGEVAESRFASLASALKVAPKVILPE